MASFARGRCRRSDVNPEEQITSDPRHWLCLAVSGFRGLPLIVTHDASKPTTPDCIHDAIIDEELPCPQKPEKQIQTFQFVGRLARRHRITYIRRRNPLIWHRNREGEANPPKRRYMGHRWRKFETFECRVFHEVDQVVAVRDEDVALVRDLVGTPHVEVVDNGMTRRIRPDGSPRLEDVWIEDAPVLRREPTRPTARAAGGVQGVTTVVHLTASTFHGGPERQILGLAGTLPPEVRTVVLSFSEGVDPETSRRRLGARGSRPTPWPTTRPISGRRHASCPTD